MANGESGRLSRKAPGRRGRKSSKRSAQSARLLEAFLETLQKTGWTPEIETALHDTSALLQIEPQFMDTLVKEARQQRNANVWRLVAEICERRNEDQSAVTYATEALQIRPGDVASMGLLARLCEKRQADTEAADWHRRLLEIEPSQIVSHRFLARFHYHRGEYEAALLYLTRLVELEPKSRTDKLYWLLAKIKSEGLLTLAQSLTEARRWRSFTPEEEPLAHELFVLVGIRCLQSRQRTRAKQYLTRAMQLAPTPEVEALLREASEQEPMTASTQTKSANPPIRISSPPVGRPLERLSTILVHDTRDRWSRVYEIVTSGAGMIAALIAVALFTVWISYTPEQPAFHGFQKEERRSTEEDVPAQPALAKVPLNEPALSDMSKPEEKILSTPAQPIPLNTPTDKALPERAPVPPLAPKPDIVDSQLTTKKEASQPNVVPTPVREKSAKASTGDKGLLPQATSAAPKVSKHTTVSPSLPGPLAEPPIVAVTPPSPARAEKRASASITPEPPTASPPSVTVSAPPTVEEKLTEETVRTVEVYEAPPSVDANAELGEAVTKEIESSTAALEPPASSPPSASASVIPSATSTVEEQTVSISATPVVEEKPTTETTDIAGVQEAPPSTIAPAESARIEEPLPANEESEQKTMAAATVEEQQFAPSMDTQTPSAGNNPPGRKGQTTAVDDSASIRTVSNTSNAIARLSSQLPYTTHFPTRERLVSVPPERLLPTMKTLVKQETRATTVVSPTRGVLRAWVSGKRTPGERPPKMYGQYLVEVIPGPTKGTSRVRAKALMFDWRTGQPIGKAGLLADRLLKKVGE